MAKNIEQYTGEEVIGAVIDNYARIAERPVYEHLQGQQERLDSIDKTLLQIPDITRLYTAYAVKNDDGENTYTIVLPVSADIEHGITIKLQ